VVLSYAVRVVRLVPRHLAGTSLVPGNALVGRAVCRNGRLEILPQH
jgi:hypothetical protein